MSLAKEISIGYANFERSGLRETEDGEDLGGVLGQRFTDRRIRISGELVKYRVRV